MMTLTYGSLFSGIGGIDLGFDRTGMTPLFQVEIDEYASKVLAKHWPNVARFTDVRKCGKHNLPYVDVLAGGFPCQDISYAGAGAGLSGKRSGLWYEFARIIRELGPRYVVVENVTALLNRGIDQVLGTLATLGYDAEWDCIPAAAIGAPHIRDRVFILAYPTSLKRKQILREHRSEQKNSTNMGWTQKKRSESGEEFVLASRHCIAGLWNPQSGVHRSLDGVPRGLDGFRQRVKQCGNAVVPQIAEYIGRTIVRDAQI